MSVLVHPIGHAKLKDMKRLVKAMAPIMLIPIHSFHPKKYKDHFPNVLLADYGEIVKL